MSFETSRLKRSNKADVKREIDEYFFGGGYQQSLGLQSQFSEEFEECIVKLDDQILHPHPYTEVPVHVAVYGKDTIRIIA